MWFDDWTAIGQILGKGAIGFGALIFLLRVAGKRTLAKFNAFDMVLTFTVGSLLAMLILGKTTTVADGLTAIALLVFLQWATASLATRSDAFLHLIKSEPTLLFYDGRYQRGAMRKERVAEVEILSALRQQGFRRLDEVRAVVLETNGEISVLGKGEVGPAETLRIEGIDTRGDNA